MASRELVHDSVELVPYIGEETEMGLSNSWPVVYVIMEWEYSNKVHYSKTQQVIWVGLN